MKIKLSKWGNSLGLRIPKALAEGLRPDQTVELTRVGDKIEIELTSKAGRIPRYDIEEIFEEMKRKGPLDPGPTLEWGPDRGSEILPEDEYSRGDITHEDLVSRKNVARRR